MVRRASDKTKSKIFGARMKKKFLEWQENRRKEGKPFSMKAFGEMLSPRASRGSIENYLKGKQLPGRDRIKQICELLGVDEEYFDLENASHGELYEYSSAFQEDVAQKNLSFAKERGLDVSFVEALSKIVDFDTWFPVYSDIRYKREIELKPNGDATMAIEFYRPDTADPAPIDGSLRFMQVNQDGKITTMHRADMAFLKEVQDQVVRFVEFLFYERSKEMDREIEKCTADLTLDDLDGDGKVKLDFILRHDRFAWVFDGIYSDQKKGK